MEAFQNFVPMMLFAGTISLLEISGFPFFFFFFSVLCSKIMICALVNVLVFFFFFLSVFFWFFVFFSPDSVKSASFSSLRAVFLWIVELM